ncbi:MAG: nucleotide exchange factor GrpE [Chitinivibrionia bacterium]|nr:nucleotide exchange factor GrpE [Chitinivibrionia bacterium]
MSKKQAKAEEHIENAQEAEFEVKGKDEEFALMAEELVVQKDKYVRLMAEFDNFKKRTAAEYLKMVEQANKGLMNDLIDVSEVFQKALDPNIPQDGAAFKDGIGLLYAKYSEILAKHGLESFGEVGDEFDPSLHDAMMKQPSDTIDAGKISVIFQRGYKLKSNIIRHAKVVVSDGKQ